MLARSRRPRDLARARRLRPHADPAAARCRGAAPRSQTDHRLLRCDGAARVGACGRRARRAWADGGPARRARRADDRAPDRARSAMPRAPGVRPWRSRVTARVAIADRCSPATSRWCRCSSARRGQLPVRGAIAMIEEVGERPYELDRYLTQLALTGELAQLAAVIVGDSHALRGSESADRRAGSGGCRAADGARAAARARARPRRSARRSVMATATRRCRSVPTRSSISMRGTLEITEPAVD